MFRKQILLAAVLLMCGATAANARLKIGDRTIDAGKAINAISDVATAWAQDYVIYPVPQTQQLTAGTARVAGPVNIVAEPGIDEITVARARQVLADHGIASSVSRKTAAGRTNLLLGLRGSGRIADKTADKQGLDRSVFSQPKYDRHIVSLTADKKGRAQLLVLGEHTDAVFCGLATIEQMLDHGTANLPCVRFYDYADLRSRGVIEGY